MIEHMVFLPGQLRILRSGNRSISFDHEKNFVLSFEQETCRVFSGQLLVKPDIVGILLMNRDNHHFSRTVIVGPEFSIPTMYMVLRTGLLTRLKDYDLSIEDYTRIAENPEIMRSVDSVEMGVKALRVLL